MRRRHFLALIAATASAETAPRWVRASVWPGAEAPDPKTLEAKLDGRAAKVLRVHTGADDLLLLAVLDMTGDLTLIDAARQALVSSIEKLPANAWAGVLRAQDGLRVLADPGPDRPTAIEAIKNAQVAGRAGLLETVEGAQRLASSLIRKTSVRAAVLYVTDSNIYNYREDYTNPVINYSDDGDLSRRFPEGLIRERTARLKDTLAGFDAPLFIVHLSLLRDRLNEAYQNGLQQMAEATGGTVSFSRTPAEIPINVEQAFDRIGKHWAVDVEVPDGAAKTFTVQISGGGHDLAGRTRFHQR